MNNLIIFSAKYLYIVEVALLVLCWMVLPKNRRRALLILSVIYLPLVYVVAKVGGILYVDPRPFVVGHFAPLIPHAMDNGFPSDHMLLGSAIASIIFVYNRKWGTVAWVVAFVVGASRVFAGIHHWIDIVGSVVIAVVMMWIVNHYLIPRQIKKRISGK